MFDKDFEEFRHLVLRNPALQERLRETTERDLFVRRIVEVGAEHGFGFTSETVEQAMRASRRDWIERGA